MPYAPSGSNRNNPNQVGASADVDFYSEGAPFESRYPD
jgi:hypothetical protein